MTNQEVHPHSCSCGDKYINHAHDFPELGCICLTCGKGSNKPEEVVFDEDLVKYLEMMIKLVEDPKTTTRFDHVRGAVEQRELMVLYLNKAIEIITLGKPKK
tara:strand:- start:275 stop:580 length:306 start_codon:yes stop_codon:yes gene_type:complete